MANKVLLKKSSVAAKVPLVTDLDYGELALNYSDGKLYYKNAANAVTPLSDASKLALAGGAMTGSTTVGTGNYIRFGPNPTWASTLQVGGDGVGAITRTGTIASVVTTNGNLHLDSGSDKAAYLNFYSGTGGVNFGNGASATTANVSAGGVFNGTNVTVNGYQTLHASNYTAFSPTLTGGSASGTWGISVTGNAGTATTLQTSRTINGTSFNGSAAIDTTEWFHSDRDFPNGTLITTNINYAVTSGDPFVLEIRGNSYSNIVPLDLLYQGYIYSDTIINHGGVSNGLSISGLVAINNGGNLCFWFPSQGYWNGYNVKVYSAYATRALNRVTSITDVAKPTTAKEVALSANIRQSLHSGNYNSYSPTLTGGSASGTWGISVTGTSGSISGFNNPVTAPTASTIVYRDAAGDISAREIVLSSGLSAVTPTVLVSMYPTTNQMVRTTPAAVAAALSGQAMNIAGSATSVTGGLKTINGSSIIGSGDIAVSVANFTSSISSSTVTPDSPPTINTLGYAAQAGLPFAQTDGGLYTAGYDAVSWKHQIFGDFRSGQIAVRGKNSGTWQAWRTVLDSSNYTSYAAGLSSSNSWTGANSFVANQNTASGSSPPLQVYGTTSGAMMSFHRGGYYAVNMGLDSDNVIRIGGWSAAANRLQMDMSGNLTMAGNVTAYSDERLKKDWEVLPINFVQNLALVKVGTFTRIDSEERQVGVSAQSLKNLMPEAVQDDGEYLSVAYGNAALASAVELAKEVVSLNARIARLEALVSKLIEG